MSYESSSDAFDPTDPLIQELAAHNPMPSALLAELASGVRTRADLETILATPRSRWRRFRRLLIAAAATVLALGGGAVAYAAVSAGNSTVSVACYAAPTLKAKLAVTPLAQQGPSATCAALWQRGAAGLPEGSPPLVVCVLGSGVDVVFPSSSTTLCKSLGLAAAGQPPADTDQIVRLRDEIGQDGAPSNCLAPGTAKKDVLAAIHKLGLAGWTVRVATGFSSAEPCTSFDLQPSEQLVLIVPLPSPTAGSPASSISRQ